jgi:hypothetical protein
LRALNQTMPKGASCLNRTDKVPSAKV